MFGFGRGRWRVGNSVDTLDMSLVRALGGDVDRDWPGAMAIDISSYAKCVDSTLQRARQKAIDQAVSVDETFTYKIRQTPPGITVHEIACGMKSLAGKYGLRYGLTAADGTVYLTRIE